MESLEREARPAGVMMIPIPRAGRLRQVRGLEGARRMPGIENVTITIPLGQEVVPLPEGNKYLGFIFARERTPQKVEAALREAHGRGPDQVLARIMAAILNAMRLPLRRW